MVWVMESSGPLQLASSSNTRVAASQPVQFCRHIAIRFHVLSPREKDVVLEQTTRT